MKEIIRTASLFEKLYHGSPWIDVNIIDTLKGISAKEASARIFNDTNTIFEIVTHLVNWRLNVLKRVQGMVIETSADNYFERQNEVSEGQWKNAMKELNSSQLGWISFLKEMNDKDLDKIYSGNDLNYYEHIHGIIQHDSYHLGQIVFISKILKRKKTT